MRCAKAVVGAGRRGSGRDGPQRDLHAGSRPARAARPPRSTDASARGPFRAQRRGERPVAAQLPGHVGAADESVDRAASRHVPDSGLPAGDTSQHHQPVRGEDRDPAGKAALPATVGHPAPAGTLDPHRLDEAVASCRRWREVVAAGGLARARRLRAGGWSGRRHPDRPAAPDGANRRSRRPRGAATSPECPPPRARGTAAGRPGPSRWNRERRATRRPAPGARGGNGPRRSGRALARADEQVEAGAAGVEDRRRRRPWRRPRG